MKESKPFSFRSALIFAATAVISLTAPFASAVTLTFNTEGTTNWTCPAGVFEIQVEVWGGGGAGGAGTKVGNTGTNTIQNGGGGGGGGYARVTTVPVTPGLSYAITIPAAAVSGTNGLLAGNIVNGEAVSFTGDASVTVTANGGAGGRNAYVSGANAPSGATGGAGGAGTSGDVVTSGGNGANGTTGGGNVSGGGGGSGGDTTNGSNGSGANGGAGGVAGGGAGGDGSAAGTVFASRTDGSPGTTPGGGGGGAHNLGQNTYFGGTGGLGQIVISYPGATIVKDDNVLDLNDGASWVGGTAPLSDNPAKWDATVTGANSTLLGADAIWGGIEIVDPAGLVTIGGSNILTLGDAAVDLDLSAATQNLTLDCDLALGAAHVWDVASGRTLTLNGEVSGTSSINIEGEGVTVLSGDGVYTGSTTLNGGTLDITGSLTGDTSSSRINIFPASGNAVVNYNGGTSTLQSVRGANVVGTSSVFNMSGGLVTVSPGNTTGTQSVSGTGNNSGVGAYGCYNITNGTFKNTNRFTMTGQAPADPVVGPDSSLQTAVVYVGGTGVIDQTNGEWWLNYSLGQITVADSGIIDRTGSTSPFGLIMNHAANNTGGGYGVLNIAGADAQVILGAQPIRFGNSTNVAQGSGQSGFVNVAAGTLSVGTNVNKSLPSSPVSINNAYFNFAGGTVKASGNVSGWIPLSDSSINFNANLYGPIDNPGTTEDFTGGLTVDSDGFEFAIANPLQPAGGFGVTQADLTVTGGSDYVGPPAVIFSDANVLAGGSPAAGYAVISGGSVTAIVITSPGTYDTATTPDVILVGGGGTGASVTSGELATPNTSGDLTKVGEGTLVLSGPNTYSGATLASVGDLKFSTAGTGVSDVTVEANAAAGALVAVDDGQFISTGDLTLDNNSALAIDYGSTVPSTTVAPIAVVDFNLGTNLGLKLQGAQIPTLAVSQAYPLITWSGSGPAAGPVTNFTNILSSHVGGTFSVTGNTLFLTVTYNASGQPITWNTGDGTWDTVSNNWLDSASVTTAYIDPQDPVIFGDAAGASGNPAVTLNSILTPLSVTMNSTLHDYTISGTGGIAGAGALTLEAVNTRTLTLSTDNDTFSGDVTINGGTLVGAGAFSGSGGVRVFGTGSSARTFTVNSGTTLRFDSGNIFSGNFSTTNVPAVVVNGGTVTNGGIATNNALGLLTLNNGTLTATTGSTSGYGGFNLNNTVTSTGTSLISTSEVTNGVMMLTSNGPNNVATSTTFDVQSGTLTISAPLGEVSGESKISGLTKSGAGTMVLSGTNTYSGTTAIDEGILDITAAQTLAGGLTFGTTAGSATTGALDLSAASATFADEALVQTNNAVANTISIGATQTLALNGGLTMGYDAGGGTGATESNLTVSGAGSLAITGTTIRVSVNQAANNQGYWSAPTLDVSGLAAFSTDVTNFNVGVGNNTHGPGQVLLSNTANTLVATQLQVGNTGANNGRGTSTLTLGTGTNVIQVDTVWIGRNKSSGPGVVKFDSQAPSSPGTVVITDKAGTGRANFDIANIESNGTGGGAIGTLDLRGHVATVSAGTFTLGNHNGNAANASTTTGTVHFDEGTFDVDTLNVAPKSNGGLGTARGTLNVGGGDFIVNTAFTLGSQVGNGASLATVNLTGGTLTSNVDIVDGGGSTTSTINLSGGTLDMVGNAIGTSGDPIDLNAESGTLQNVASINGTGGFTKTTTGTLLLTGTNNYTGATIVFEGTLDLVGGSHSSAITANNTASLGFDLASSTSSTASVTFDAGSTVTITGTPTLPSYTLMTASLFDGIAPVLAAPIAGYALMVDGGTTLKLVQAVGGYGTWATTNAGGQTEDLDFDNDGVQNGIEYFMNAAAGFTPNPQLDGTNTITWPNGGNIASSEYGPTGQFVIQTSSDLANWANVDVGDLSTNTDGPGGSLTYTLTGGAPRFVRLMVTPN